MDGTLAVALGWGGGPATYPMTAVLFLAVARWGWVPGPIPLCEVTRATMKALPTHVILPRSKDVDGLFLRLVLIGRPSLPPGQ